MSVKTHPLNELERAVYQKIISGKRLFSYWTPQDFIYVTEYNETVCIHYRMRFRDKHLVIDYVLTSEKTDLKFQPETRKMILVPMPD